MQATVAIEPSTQTPVDLKGLSDHERLYCLMAEFCDRETFQAANNSACLFGQVAARFGYKPGSLTRSYEFVTDALGLQDDPSYRYIYDAARWYMGDLDGALAMARRVLGIA